MIGKLDLENWFSIGLKKSKNKIKSAIPWI